MTYFSLSKCPFCGEWGSLIMEETMDGQYAVVCSVHEDGCGASSRFEDDEHSAAESWNTRHTPEGYKLVPVEATDKTVKMIAELAGELEESADWDFDIRQTYKAMIEGE